MDTIMPPVILAAGCATLYESQNCHFTPEVIVMPSAEAPHGTCQAAADAVTLGHSKEMLQAHSHQEAQVESQQSRMLEHSCEGVWTPAPSPQPSLAASDTWLAVQRVHQTPGLLLICSTRACHVSGNALQQVSLPCKSKRNNCLAVLL